ncbi:MAG TPA: SMC family ATPase [Candidatus Bathyarchaeia archaeon]|nr:SMC family ATPase [Candidatus Bathyarchaeia archaeon]
MIIHRLSVSGFKMIGDSITLEFPDEGKIGLFGGNESGKSTLLESMEYALYGLRKGKSAEEASREDVITWGKESAKLKLEFTSGTERYILEREIGLRTGHRARLNQIRDGARSSSMTNLTKIGEEIDRITGMDRDSFTRLVYVRQKDLDVLRKLEKSSREQLVNKVMGMEAFDKADEALQGKLKAVREEYERIWIEFNNVRRERELYEEKQTRMIQLERETSELKDKLDLASEEIEMKKAVLWKFDWLGKIKTKEELLHEKMKLKERIDEEIDALAKSRKRLGELAHQLKEYEGIEDKLGALRKISQSFEDLENTRQDKIDLKRKILEAEKRLETQQNLLRTIEPEYIHLSEDLDSYKNLEEKLEDLSKDLESREKSQLIEMTRIGLKGYSTQNFARLQTNKSRYLVASIISLIAGLLLASSAILFIFMFLPAIACLALSSYCFARYFKMEKLSATHLTLQAGAREIVSTEERLKEVKSELNGLKNKTCFGSSQEIEKRLSVLRSKIDETTGQDSLDGLKVLCRNSEVALTELKDALDAASTRINLFQSRIDEEGKKVEIESDIGNQIKRFEDMKDAKSRLSANKKNEEDRIHDLERGQPDKRSKELLKEIIEIEAELTELLNTKPEGIENLAYVETVHDQMKMETDNASKTFNDLKNQYVSRQSTMNALGQELQHLEKSHDAYPAMAIKVEDLKLNQAVIDRTRMEISETSRKLRNKVIPYARYIINQILPTITDGRYSDLQISEDLKFQAHSTEAGGYKEQVVFSGGTQDQFLIALRLAFTASILDSRVKADYYSLLMDECISSSDEERRKGFFEVLDAMKKTFRQIFIIAHEDISEYVDHYMTLVRNEKGYSQIKSKSW